MKCAPFLSIILFASILEVSYAHAQGAPDSMEERIIYNLSRKRDAVCPTEKDPLICIFDFNEAVGSIRTIERLRRRMHYMAARGDTDKAQRFWHYIEEEFANMDTQFAKLKGKYKNF